MNAYEPFAALTCAATLGLLFANYRGSRVGEWLLKPIAAAGFIAAAIANGAVQTRFGSALVVGLCLSFCGDVLLIPRARATFLAGLVAFLLGHVAYVAAFAIRGVDLVAMVSAGTCCTAVALVVARWLLPFVEPPMRPPVVAYVVVISAMVAMAVGTYAQHGNPWLVLGALCFYASDLSVARDRFVSPGFTNKVWGWPLYFGAQLVFAWCAGHV